MLDISMDITTAATVVSSLATILGFVWALIHHRSKKTDDDEDIAADVAAEREQDAEIVKLQTLVDELERTIRDHGVELDKLSELSAIYKDENVRLRQDFLDNLDRIENRLEKMIDLILRIKHD